MLSMWSRPPRHRVTHALYTCARVHVCLCLCSGVCVAVLRVSVASNCGCVVERGVSFTRVGVFVCACSWMGGVNSVPRQVSPPVACFVSEVPAVETTELTARILKRSSAKSALTEPRGHGSKKGAFANKLKNET